MTRLSLEYKLRTAHVKRWQIVRVGRDQTLAEHHYLVWHITAELIKAMHGPEPACGVTYANDMMLALEWALTHDIPEVITGDLATPVKRAMREAVPHEDPIRRVELDLDEDYRVLYLRLKTQEPHLLHAVKLADLIEAMRFLAFEGQGNQARAALMNLWTAYLDIIDEAMARWPQYAWCAITTRIVCAVVRPELDHAALLTFDHHGSSRQGGKDAYGG